MIILVSLKQSSFTQQNMTLGDQNTRDQFSMDNREGGSHERGVYATQDTPRMRTARMI